MTEKPTCSESGCEGPVLARGLCSAHYQRAWKREAGRVKPKPLVTCEQCGAEFRSHRGRFCSRRCGNAAYWQRHRERLYAAKAERRRLGLTERYPATCVVCGRDFTATVPNARYCTTGAGSCEAVGKRERARAAREAA